MTSARFFRHFHAVMTVLWALMMPVSETHWLRNSVPFLVLISVWANFAGHFGSWQAARAECAQLNDTKGGC